MNEDVTQQSNEYGQPRIDGQLIPNSAPVHKAHTARLGTAHDLFRLSAR